MTRRPPDDDERGFVLIGVFMFVLVLVILGLSLFSLSGYEAQFLGGSIDRQRAFYDGLGGIDRARWVLARTEDENKVKLNLPPGVVYAVAKQGDAFETADSTKLINWYNGKPVWIRTLSVTNGQRQLLEARFTPIKPAGAYKRLMTLVGDLNVIGLDPSDGIDHSQYTTLHGEVWKATASVPLMAPGSTYSARTPPGGVPVPDLHGTWWTNHWAIAQETADAPNNKYDLGTSGSVTYYKTSYVGNPADWSFYETKLNPTPTINVYGTVVWMFDRGVRYDPELHLVGKSPDAMLVFVARSGSAGGSEAGIGVDMLGTITTEPANPTRVILISDAGVSVEHTSARVYDASSIDYLTIFADHAQLRGPAPNIGSPFDQLTVSHSLGAPEDAQGGLIDILIQLKALPNMDKTPDGSFKLIAGTWRNIKDADGDPNGDGQ